MKEMWNTIDILLEKYGQRYGIKPIDQMQEGSEEWFARVMYSLLTTLSMMQEDNDAS